MDDDTEHMQLPDGNMPQVGKRSPGPADVSINDGINLAEQLAEEANVATALRALGDQPFGVHTMLSLLLELTERSVESSDAMTKMFEELTVQLRLNQSINGGNRRDSILSTVPTNSSDAGEPFPEKRRIDSITEGYPLLDYLKMITILQRYSSELEDGKAHITLGFSQKAWGQIASSITSSAAAKQLRREKSVLELENYF